MTQNNPIRARRSRLQAPANHAAHAGLIYTRFLENAPNTTDAANQAKQDLLKWAARSVGRGQALYQLAYDRWKGELDSAAVWESSTSSRLILGLGGENVTETGITLHHTYGVPYIPGTALKGLAAHYAHNVYGGDWKLAGKAHRLIFGGEEEAGLIQFHDAWICPDSLASCLRADVMTPHHGKYYMQQSDAGPTDFDSPIPVPFLSVTGRFLLALNSWASNIPAEYLDITRTLLTRALAEWGVGGKTASGYGRLVE